MAEDSAICVFVCVCENKKAVLLQGNRAMLRVIN